jgi:predicted branched-subunit amino acid permease
MSVLQYAGSSQLAATAVLAADGGAAAAVAAGVMLNARFLPMSVVAAPALRGSRLRRSIEAQTIVDTSWALATRGQAGFDREAMLGATLPQYPAWVLGTATGVLFGGLLNDSQVFGLDAVVPAFFLALLVHEIRHRRPVVACQFGGAIALALTPILSPGLPILLASAGALIGLKNEPYLGHDRRTGRAHGIDQGERSADHGHSEVARKGRRHHRSARTSSARRLVLTEAFAIGKSLTVDARAVGLGCAAVAMASRAPLLVVVVIAAAATAVTRAILA